MIKLHVVRIFKFIFAMSLVFSSIIIEKSFNIKIPELPKNLLLMLGILSFFMMIDIIIYGLGSLVSILCYPFVKYKLNNYTKRFNKEYSHLKIEYLLDIDCLISEINIRDGNELYRINKNYPDKNNDILFLLKIKKEFIFFYR